MQKLIQKKPYQRNKDEWYRSGNWNKEAQNIFEAKLARSRSDFHKAQYLKIKAWSLQQAGNTRAARALYERMISDYPNEDQIVLALEALGQSYEKEGNYIKAETYYRECIKRSTEHPSVWAIHSEFYLARIIVKAKQKDKYNEAEALLDKILHEDYLVFNAQIYEYCIIRVQLALRLKKTAQAIAHARRALQAVLDGRRPQFPRHPDIGLVQVDIQILSWLEKILELRK